MKTVLVLCIILVYAQSRPQFGFVDNHISNTVPKILNYEFVSDAAGYFFNVDTSDGFHHHAKGVIEPPTATEDEALEVQGSYSYVDSDRIQHTVQYTAGKNGFVPQVYHVPFGAGGGISACTEATLCGVGPG